MNEIQQTFKGTILFLFVVEKLTCHNLGGGFLSPGRDLLSAVC